MLSQTAEDDLISAVRAAARADILPRYRRLAPDDIRAKTRPDDLVTSADLAVEARLTHAVGDILPGARILGEEATAQDPGAIDRIDADEYCVIIDPLDGTWNFANGLSVFGTIVAVRQAAETIWGLLYDPLMDDWVVARRGGGAWYVRPGQSPRQCRFPPSVPDAPPPATAGFVDTALFPARQRPALAQRLAAGPSRTLSLRCSCHEYRTVLQNGAQWLMAPAPQPWDHAAGVLAVIECGGHAAMLEDAADYRPGRRAGTLLVARDAALWRALRDQVAPVSPEIG